MNVSTETLEKIEAIVDRDTRYKTGAYNFVLETLNYTVRKMKKRRHVSGKELLAGVKQYAREQFGPMVYTVFEHWGIISTEDIGHIVFSLVDVGVLSKTEEDSMDDFRNGYDFKKVFG